MLIQKGTWSNNMLSLIYMTWLIPFGFIPDEIVLLCGIHSNYRGQTFRHNKIVNLHTPCKNSEPSKILMLQQDFIPEHNAENMS